MRQYFTHAQLEVSGAQRYRAALEMHQVSEEDARQLLEAEAGWLLALDFEDGRLTGGLTLSGPDEEFDGEPLETELIADSELEPLEAPPHAMQGWAEAEEGPIRIGGVPPEGFRYPEARFASGYQYIGEIGAALTGGSAVPLLYPVFLSYHPPVFLDVSDPLAPAVLPIREGRMLNWRGVAPLSTDAVPYGPVQEDNEIVRAFAEGGEVLWRAQHYRLEPWRLGPEEIPGWGGSSGAPLWLQYPELPISPRTGRQMRFLGQFGGGNPLARTDVALPGPWAEAAEALEFWSMGELYVFHEAETGLLCLHPQAT